jgi:hypothetical protein
VHESLERLLGIRDPTSSQKLERGIERRARFLRDIGSDATQIVEPSQRTVGRAAANEDLDQLELHREIHWCDGADGL